MSTTQGQCKRCGDVNAYTEIVCKGCGSRLPWAQASQEAQKAALPTPVPLPSAAPPPQISRQYSRFCQHCGAPMSSLMSICPQCRQNVRSYPADSTQQDGVGTLLGYAFLSVLIPFLGVIVGIVMLFSKPQRGAACLAGSVLGFIVGGMLLFSPGQPVNTDANPSSISGSEVISKTDASSNVGTPVSETVDKAKLADGLRTFNASQAEQSVAGAYMNGLTSAMQPLDTAMSDFMRVSQASPTPDDLMSMLSNNGALLQNSLSQMNALQPPTRFQSGHDHLRSGVRDLIAAQSSLLNAVNDRSEDGIRRGIDKTGASYQTVGYAKKELGSQMSAYAEELNQAAQNVPER